jgi:hypothetical protein
MSGVENGSSAIRVVSIRAGGVDLEGLGNPVVDDGFHRS